MTKAPTRAERIEIRRNAKVRPPTPIRQRGPEYLTAHACFDCRKSWKRHPGTSAGCPQCGGPLHEMGRTFRTPKASHVEQWEKVRALWAAGFRFASYRSHPGAEALPERLSEVEAFVRRNPDHPMRVRAAPGPRAPETDD